MLAGIYLRTEKHRLINKGRKFPNRKRYSKGITPIPKICEFCKKDFITDCYMPNKRFCSPSCRSKSYPEINLQNLSKVDREKQREMMHNRIGEKHFAWVKDRSLLKDDHRDRGGQLHREWSNSVKKRDEYKCKIDNQDCKGILESHHILSWKDNPELRYELNNGITLCHFHHPKKRKDEIESISYFKELLKSL